MKNLTLLKNNLLQKKRQRGLTLVEVGLAVLISAIIIIGVMYMYSSTSTNTNLLQLTNDVTSIRSAVISYHQATGKQAPKITYLVANGFLTLKSSDGTGANPWHGDYSVKGYPTTYNISATGLPNAVCKRAALELGDTPGTFKKPGCSGSDDSTTLTLHFAYTTQ